MCHLAAGAEVAGAGLALTTSTVGGVAAPTVAAAVAAASAAAALDSALVAAPVVAGWLVQSRAAPSARRQP